MRTDWDTYFLEIAEVVSTRATCDRRHCGAVVVRDRFILSTGYNGSFKGAPHCDDVGHMLREGHCVRTIHAEVNAIAQAARNGVSLEDSTIYVNTIPCWNCFKACANVGISRFVFKDSYSKDSAVFDAAKQLGIELKVV